MKKIKSNIRAADASMYKYPYQNLSLVDMAGEIWHPIPNLDEYFAVSNLGRIKRLARWIYYIDGRKWFMKEIIMSQRPTVKIILSNGKLNMPSLITVGEIRGKPHTIFVARAVYAAFVEKLDNTKKYEQFILHKDLDGFNNRIENLYLATQKELNERNIKHGINPVAVAIPEIHAKSVLVNSKPISQYDLSGIYLNTYPSVREAVRQTGIDCKSIIDTAKRKSRNAKGFIWRYGTIEPS